jgi:hypothetical protein
MTGRLLTVVVLLSLVPCRWRRAGANVQGWKIRYQGSGTDYVAVSRHGRGRRAPP